MFPRDALAVCSEWGSQGRLPDLAVGEGSMGHWGLGDAAEQEAMATVQQRENSTQKQRFWSLKS